MARKRNERQRITMNVREAIETRRTVRKFTQRKIDRADLHEMIDCARLAAYGANLQPLKFKAVTDEGEVNAIFPYIKWAGYLENGAPEEGERPTAYIAVLGDTEIKKNGSFETDAGAAVTTMMLRATELELATCWLGAINREQISKVLDIPENLQLLYLLAVGESAQKSVTCDMKDGDVKYFVGEGDVLNVPKRSLEEIIIGE